VTHTCIYVSSQECAGTFFGYVYLNTSNRMFLYLHFLILNISFVAAMPRQIKSGYLLHYKSEFFYVLVTAIEGEHFAKLLSM